MIYLKHSFLVLLFIPTLSYALSFSSDTIFLDAKSQTECSAQGGHWTEWYGQTYCTKPGEKTPSIQLLDTQQLAVNYVKKAGIVEGYPDGEFRAENNVNRVELLKILIEANPKNYPQCFQRFDYSDTIIGAWYETYLQTASCSNIVSGYPDGTFKPGNPVSVVEAAKMISLAFSHEVTKTDGVWYEGFIHNLADRNALPKSLSSLEAHLTRGQLAEIVYRLKKDIINLPSHSLESLESSF